MKYIYCLLITLVITNHLFSNNDLHYEYDSGRKIAPHTLPNNDHDKFAEKMTRIKLDRERQARVHDERRIRNIEQQMIYSSLGITGINPVPFSN